MLRTKYLYSPVFSQNALEGRHEYPIILVLKSIQIRACLEEFVVGGHELLFSKVPCAENKGIIAQSIQSVKNGDEVPAKRHLPRTSFAKSCDGNGGTVIFLSSFVTLITRITKKLFTFIRICRKM